MADLLAQPCARDCGHGLLRRPDDRLQPAQCTCHGSDRPQDLVWINVTRSPTAESVARQITEAFPWDEAPGYMIRDRDRIYRGILTRRLRAMGIRVIQALATDRSD
jgi:hypothetical protein